MPDALTDEDRAILAEIIKPPHYEGDSFVMPITTHAEIYLAGKAAGRAQGLEDAAKICDYYGLYIATPEDYCAEECATRIRALLTAPKGTRK